MQDYKVIECPVCNNLVLVILGIINKHFRCFQFVDQKYGVIKDDWIKCSGSDRIV